MRRLLSLPAASLLLGGLTLAMWLRSHRVGEQLAGWYFIINSGGGSLEVFVATRDCFPRPPFRFGVSRLTSPRYVSDPAVWGDAWRPLSSQRTAHGFSFRTYRCYTSLPGAPIQNSIPAQWLRVATQGWSLVFPYAVLESVLLAPLVWRLGRAWRRKKRNGLCTHCGYDLRATPERCPECGRRG